jgi:hypothetical protein
MILDVVEEQGGRARLPSSKVGDGADLLLPMDAVQLF